MKLVTLCSGGLDSVTLAYLLANEGHTQTLLFVDYAQKQLKERISAGQCACDLGVPLRYVTITGADIFKGDTTIVPNRNSIMANLAAAAALRLDYDGIALGIHSEDRPTYPDCTPKFVYALERLLTIATGRPLCVRAPFLHHTKSQIVFQGAMLGVPFTKTWSCYEGRKWHCGVCSACEARKAAFRDVGIVDPTRYER